MQVTMTRDVLIQVLKANLAEHESVYAEAVAGYLKDLQAGFLTLTAEVDAVILAGKGRAPSLDSLILTVPLSYAEVYEEAIEMLRCTTEETIVLTQSEFRQYVLDKWTWQQSFSASNSRYLSGETMGKLK